MQIDLPGLEPIIQPVDRRMPVELTDAEIAALRNPPPGQEGLFVDYPRLPADDALRAFLLDMQAAFQTLADRGLNVRSVGVGNFKIGYFGPNTDPSFPAVNVGRSVAFVHNVTGKLSLVAMAPPPGWPTTKWTVNAAVGLVALAD
jgi:hypothetical protein